jgi:hypothetical protein
MNLKLEIYDDFPVSAVEHLNFGVVNFVLNGNPLERNLLFSAKISHSLGFLYNFKYLCLKHMRTARKSPDGCGFVIDIFNCTSSKCKFHSLTHFSFYDASEV